MESRVKALGHPIHPILIAFPVGLFVTAVAFDVIYLVTNDASFATVSFWNIVAGVAGGLVAALFGFLDWLAIPGGTRAKRVGIWHGLGNALVLGLFAASALLRWGERLNLPGAVAFGFALAGSATIGVTGWLGGELVDRLGVGVDEGANLNAPNSLSGQPARTTGETPT